MKVGQTIENFTAEDQFSNTVELDALLKEGPVVLFFYPRAMTPLCTKQSCHFRDLKNDFAAAQSHVIGVSGDQASDQKKFDSINNLGIPLITDTDHKLAKQFGVKRFGPLGVKRSTFVISQTSKLLGSYFSEIKAHEHADWALELLKNNSNK